MPDLVSIVIPTYNMERFVFDAINSAFDQTYSDIEVIVVDDGSTDGTLEKLKSTFEGKSPKRSLVIMHKKNGGTASALNRGIKQAKGKWIHWLSADDMLLPNAVETMLKYIGYFNTETQQNAIFFSSWYAVDTNGNKLYDFVEKNRSDMTRPAILRELAHHYFGNGSSSMIHQYVFAKYGMFDAKLPVCEDYEFWMRLSMLHSVSLITVPEFTLKYRIHDNNLSKQWKDKAWKVENVFKRRIIDEYNKENPNEPIEWTEHQG